MNVPGSRRKFSRSFLIGTREDPLKTGGVTQACLPGCDSGCPNKRTQNTELRILLLYTGTIWCHGPVYQRRLFSVGGDGGASRARKGPLLHLKIFCKSKSFFVVGGFVIPGFFLWCVFRKGTNPEVAYDIPSRFRQESIAHLCSKQQQHRLLLLHLVGVLFVYIGTPSLALFYAHRAELTTESTDRQKRIKDSIKYVMSSWVPCRLHVVEKNKKHVSHNKIRRYKRGRIPTAFCRSKPQQQ